MFLHTNTKGTDQTEQKVTNKYVTQTRAVVSVTQFEFAGSIPGSRALFH